MVLDEGHVVKNPSTTVFNAVTHFASSVSHRVVLTGTPVQNSVLELWPLFHFLMPNLLGTRKAFDHAYTQPVRTLRAAGNTSTRQMREDYIVAIEDLHLRVSPFIMRREKGEVLKDLPPKVIQDVHCVPSLVQTRLHDAFSGSVEGARVKAQLAEYSRANQHGKTSIAKLPRMVGLQYLRMMCSHPCLVSKNFFDRDVAARESLDVDAKESGKMMALLRLFAEAGIGNGFSDTAELVGSSSSSSSSSSSPSSLVKVAHSSDVTPFRPPKSGWPHKFLVFAHFRRTLDLLEQSIFRRHMPGVAYVRLDGNVSPSKRGEVVSRFNKDINVACMLLTTGVGGVGLNLTAADTVVFFEPDWNPMVDLQAMDRAHRIGQIRSVNVYRLITDHTLEEYMMDVQGFKIQLAKDVMGGVRGGLGRCGGDGTAAVGHAKAVPSGAPRIGQVFGGGVGPGDGYGSSSKVELQEAEDVDEGEYELHSIESFIQSLSSK